MGKLISRNVTVNGHRTSLRLEEETWAAIEDICRAEKTNIHTLCSLLDRRRQGLSRTSAVRVFVLSYFRTAARAGGRMPAGTVNAVLPEFAAHRQQRQTPPGL
jgi:predicted DNA-binding ribbon-helix-helix protein